MKRNTSILRERKHFEVYHSRPELPSMTTIRHLKKSQKKDNSHECVFPESSQICAVPHQPFLADQRLACPPLCPAHPCVLYQDSHWLSTVQLLQLDSLGKAPYNLQ